MDNNTQHIGDQTIDALSKDFKIVGGHHVHGWYAWAIVGIVFGMAMAMVYVANLQGKFEASQAATDIGGEIAAGSRTPFSAMTTPIIVSFASDGSEQYEIIVPPALVVSEDSSQRGSSFQGTCLGEGPCGPATTPQSQPTSGEAVTVPKDNQGANWVDSIPGNAAWISYRRNPTAANAQKFPSGTVVKFTKTIRLKNSVTQGVIWVYAVDHAKVHLDGKMIGTTVKSSNGSQSSFFVLPDLSAGKHTLGLVVAPRESGAVRPVSVAFAGSFLEAQPYPLRQTITAGDKYVKVMTATTLAAGPEETLQYVMVRFHQTDTTASNVRWLDAMKALTSINNLLLIDDATGKTIASMPELISGEGAGKCSFTGTTFACFFGHPNAPLNYRFTNLTPGVSHSISAYADFSPTITKAQLSMFNFARFVVGEPKNSKDTSKNVDVVPNDTLLVVVPLPPVPPPAPPAPPAPPTPPAPPAPPTTPAVFQINPENPNTHTFSIGVTGGSRPKLKSITVRVITSSDQFISIIDGNTASFFGSSQELNCPTIGVPCTLTFRPDYILLPGTIKALSMRAGPNTRVTLEKASDFVWADTDGVEHTLPDGSFPIVLLSPFDRSGNQRPTLSASDNHIGASRSLVMGSTNNDLFSLRLSADSVDDLRVTDITITDTITNNANNLPSFVNLSLYDGATRVAGQFAMSSFSAVGGKVIFTLTGSGLVIPKNSSKILTLRGDVATYTSGGAVSGSKHVFNIDKGSDIKVNSVSSPATTVTVLANPASGNTMSVYRTILLPKNAAVIGSASRSRVVIDDIASFALVADSAHQATLNTLKVTFSGGAIKSGTTAFTVDLINMTTGLPIATQQTCTPGSNGCAVTFTPNLTVNAGENRAVKVRVNSSAFYDGSAANENLILMISGSNDFTYSDGTKTNIPTDATLMPFVLANVNY